jgi:hypothetical protein
VADKNTEVGDKGDRWSVVGHCVYLPIVLGPVAGDHWTSGHKCCECRALLLVGMKKNKAARPHSVSGPMFMKASINV